jgi:hypothetical protein
MTKTPRSGQHRARRLESLAVLGRVRTTLGELIAAAFDTVGNRMDVAQLLTSRELSRVARARIILH